MSTGDRNNFGPEHAKITIPNSNNRTQLTKYLRGLPSLCFSEKGCANICQRFGVSVDELNTVVTAMQRPHPNAPNDELLSITGTAVTRINKGKGGPGEW